MGIILNKLISFRVINHKCVECITNTTLFGLTSILQNLLKTLRKFTIHPPICINYFCIIIIIENRTSPRWACSCGVCPRSTKCKIYIRTSIDINLSSKRGICTCSILPKTNFLKSIGSEEICIVKGTESKSSWSKRIVN